MTETFTKLVKEEIESHIDKTEKIILPKNTTNKVLIKKDLRIKFVKNGLVYDPSFGHHLEFCFKESSTANDTLNELMVFDISAKLSMNTKRKRIIVYMTDRSSIIETLKLLGASDSVKVYKDTVDYNAQVKDITRKVNFETANIKRTSDAYVRQLASIKKLLKIKKFESLDNDLKLIITARKKHPELSLSELSKVMGVSKSKINHGFMKIRKMIGE